MDEQDEPLAKGRPAEQPVYPFRLSWHDTNPEYHTFDPEAVHAVVRSLEPAGRVPIRPQEPADLMAVIRWGHEEGRAWTDAMDHALVRHYGPWASGWRWAHDEGDFGGGPIGGWCCPRHSITTPEETVARVADCLIEWRKWLEDLNERFARFPVRDVPPEDREWMWDRAAVHLVTQTMDRTGVGDAWYGTCALVLSWYLTANGVDADDASRLVRRAIGGRFDSWIAPKPAAIHDLGEQLARELTLLEESDERG
ncbi:hypothetical protein GCM10020367_53110 [Streptomyces sannanensis]|uniref:ADP-ribosylglycohydrolase family protein n=1 Tax=Streptomyces sannanensis TaxID=285536 RepID=A0ABP6SI24_9ACTN